MTWAQLCQNRAFADLPYKIELDKYGKVIMSPAGKKNSKLQSRMLQMLMQLMPHGDALPECAIETVEGTKAADAAWISDARWESMDPNEWSCSIAPEICIEILSPTNVA